AVSGHTSTAYCAHCVRFVRGSDVSTITANCLADGSGGPSGGLASSDQHGVRAPMTGCAGWHDAPDERRDRPSTPEQGDVTTSAPSLPCDPRTGSVSSTHKPRAGPWGL